MKQDSYHDIKNNCQQIAEKVINDFLDNSVGDLADKVADKLLGDCQNITSPGCAKYLSSTASSLILDSTESSMGVTAAKKIITIADESTSEVSSLAP